MCPGCDIAADLHGLRGSQPALLSLVNEAEKAAGPAAGGAISSPPEPDEEGTT